MYILQLQIYFIINNINTNMGNIITILNRSFFKNENDDNIHIKCLDTMENGLCKNIKDNLEKEKMYIKCLKCNISVNYICFDKWVNDNENITCINCNSTIYK